MPQNGWGCNCRVRQIGQAEVDRRGYSIGPAPDIPTDTFVNQRTGEVTDVPRGIDPGFDHNPGKSRAENLDRILAAKRARFEFGQPG